MSKEYLEALEWLLANEMIYRGRTRLPISPALREIKQRLESIDNANPSEALECLEKIIEKTDCMNNTCVHLPKCLKDNKCRYNIDDLMCPDYEMANHIKQALLKQQELPEPFKTGVDIGVIKPKHYLKWEDLEFNHTPKMIDVKMSGNKYKLVVGYNVAGKNLAILRDGKKEYYFLECDKQFFNDLHLERVEE